MRTSEEATHVSRCLDRRPTRGVAPAGPRAGDQAPHSGPSGNGPPLGGGLEPAPDRRPPADQRQASAPLSQGLSCRGLRRPSGSAPSRPEFAAHADDRGGAAPTVAPGGADLDRRAVGRVGFRAVWRSADARRPDPAAEARSDCLEADEPQRKAQAAARSRGRHEEGACGAGQKGEQDEIDVADLDEVGFAPTLPTSYSWYPVGERLKVPYEAPQGRRVNALGLYVSR